jgi:DNA-binding CsgD family transcriptional regulator
MVNAVVGRAAQDAPLLERDHELAAVTAVVDAAAAGHGATVWIEGPAGIGKTRLVGAAREHARRRGVQVLTARGGELESEFAFGVVRGLFEPAVTAQPALLAAGPARLAAPVVTLADDPPGPVAIGVERLHGLYWLTVALTDGGPLLLVVDDAHWADRPSLSALTYLARRAEELPVGIVLAARSDLGDCGHVLRSEPGTVVLRPAPLSHAATADLVDAALGPATPAFLAACHEATDGNPLLLNALLAALREDGVAPDDAGVDAVRHRAEAIVAMFVLPRLRHLPAPAAALARAIALLGTDVELRQAAALAGLPPDEAMVAADGLVDAELLAPGRPLAFAHPLIAEAVLAHMSPAERHRGHLRAARYLAGQDADPEQVGAHLLAVEPLGDPWVVARLRAAAAAALVKAAPQACVTYLRRALAEPPAPADRPTLLIELGEAQLRAADGDGHRTLRKAWELTTDPRAAARVALAVSRASRGGGNYRSAEQIVIDAVQALGDADPDLVAELETELALTWRIGTAPGLPSIARVLELADIAAARGQDATSRLLRLAALDPLRHPETDPDAAIVAARAAATGSTDTGALHAAGSVLIATDRIHDLLPVTDAVIDSARHSGRLLDLGVASTLRAQARYMLGRVRQAEEDALVADRLAVGIDAQVRRHTQAWLLHCLVERDELDEAERELTDSAVPVTLAYVQMARARLRLAQDRPAEALADLEDCGRWLARRRMLHPSVLPWQAWSAVALQRMGRDEQSRATAAAALVEARRFGSARAEGVALWASGLVERSAGVLADAVAVLGRVPAPLERARAMVDLGAALRRTNRRAEARPILEEALQLAHGSGAEALVSAARVELAAAGVHVRRPAVTGPDALTPTERRIAERAAEGASNRDIAKALFVTPKTVENHLGNAYRKLGVAGRTELRAALLG